MNIRIAQAHAQSARFPEMLAVCQQILASPETGIATLLDVGVLLSSFGFITQARDCFIRASILVPTDLRSQVNLANIARDAGEHAESRHLYAMLQERLPNNAVIRRNALVSLEYDPGVSDAQRLCQARGWGDWAATQAGGLHPRPACTTHDRRPLRIGYVSADFCQHTVGLFVQDVLSAHDPARVTAFAYSAGQGDDWVTRNIGKSCTLRNVANLGDLALADLIRYDKIDILIDLSGHTAGSRLTVFAHRPAPVQVSWLGYFATTGLVTIDAVLMDEWHLPPGEEASFVEPVIRLPGGRFCYQPVSWMPAAVPPAPNVARGYITFGCFNNTAKINEDVIDVWATILRRVPESRLILKWRTFNDAALRDKVTTAFGRRGVATERLELRGPSFHADLLMEYADLDIALDPFPFTGGLTSCEALYMGVPVVTWPQSRVVSRQTFAFLSAIGLSDLAAKDADEYVRIAVEWANNGSRLVSLRASLRDKMRASPLMDVAGFTRQLEECLIDLYRTIEAQENVKAMNPKIILHVCPGHRNNGASLPAAFLSPEWREVRLDIDPANEPDILGSMLDMAAVASGSVDAIYSSHNLEHVHAFEVSTVLQEFHRVLRPEGFLVVTCPDLQSVCALVVEDKLTDPAYQSPSGPITPLDILYGRGAVLAEGHFFMAPRCGFTLKTLTQALQAAGFASSAGKRRTKGLDLWLVATKVPMDEVALRELAGRVLPG